MREHFFVELNWIEVLCVIQIGLGLFDLNDFCTAANN